MTDRFSSKYLFLCTGNYYRSRFAEIYFNFQAARMEWPARAFSRGFEAAAARNAGAVSVFTLDYLRALEIPFPPVWDFPVQLQEADFDLADRIIALDEKEHHPMLLRDFPHRLNEVTFWHFPDIQFAKPGLILPAIREKIDGLFGA